MPCQAALFPGPGRLEISSKLLCSWTLAGGKIQAVPETAPQTTYSRAEVRRLLDIEERQLRHWERDGLIEAAENFSLPDLIALRTLKELRKDRVATETIRNAVAAVRERHADIGDPLRELRVIADGRKVRVEINGQTMEPVSGQLLFNFDRRELRRLLAFPDTGKSKRESAEQWFQRGLAFERSGSLKEAIQAYETAVQLDPKSAGAWVNLGTICFHQRQFTRAEAHYQKALEADATYALAHFNIGNLFDERGDYERALQHYRHAIELYPQYADAHYNLALLYQGGGQVMEAVRHWKLFLRLDSGSSWAAIARRELDKLRRSTVVRVPPQRPTGTRVLD